MIITRPIALIRDAELDAFNAHLDAVAASLAGKVPSAEVATWDAKSAAIAALAAARLKGPTLPPDSPERRLLRIEAALAGVTEAETEAKVTAKSAAFHLAGPAISGERQRFQARIRGANSSDQIRAEARLARARVAAIMANLAALGADPEGFAATLPQTPEDLA